MLLLPPTMTARIRPTVYGRVLARSSTPEGADRIHLGIPNPDKSAPNAAMCGRPLCRALVLGHHDPVSISAAQTHGLYGQAVSHGACGTREIKVH